MEKKITLARKDMEVRKSDEEMTITISKDALAACNIDLKYYALQEITLDLRPTEGVELFSKLQKLFLSSNVDDVIQGFSLLDMMLPSLSENGWCVLELMGFVDAEYPKGFRFEHLTLNSVFQMVRRFRPVWSSVATLNVWSTVLKLCCR